MEDEYDIGMLLETKSGHDYKHEPELDVRVRLVKVLADRKIRNFTEREGEKFYFSDLGWRAMVYARDNAPWVVDHQYGYSNVYLVSSRLAKRAYHTLCRVDAKMVQFETQLGRATDWPSQVARFGRALGVRHFITQNAAGRNGWSYDETDFYFFQPGEGVGIIQQTIAQWWANLRKDVAA